MQIIINRLLMNVFIGLMLLIVVGSIFRGAHHLDPLHWGLMFSNAQDLVNGDLPYKEIFIGHGILTTLTHAFAYYFFKINLYRAIVIPDIFYLPGGGAIYLALPKQFI